MKKCLKFILGVIGLIILLVIFDLICIFTINRPMFAIKEDNGDSVVLVYRGLFYDTYNCPEYSVPQIKAKGTKFNCDVERIDIGKVVGIVDKTKSMKDFTCAEALESFYEDDGYIYFWSCIKNQYMIVKYESGFEETISNALKYGTITLTDLDKNNISYIKEEKIQEELQSPPSLFVYTENSEKPVKATIGTYSWKVTKNGKVQEILADSLHPSQMRFNNDNILELNDLKVKIKSENAIIYNANIYNINETEKIDRKINFDNTAIYLDNLEKGEYVLEIIAEYSQGKVCNAVKLIVK